MPAEVKKEIQLEIAHVLFTDIVGYSKLPINAQRALVERLIEIVRDTDEFKAAEAAGRLIKIPTGDGITLVFYQSPEAPVECGLEISRALKKYPELQLRMGIHSGPVSGVIDVTGEANVAGAGINMAQRVMDCGDAGHILLSKRASEDLEQYPHWQPYLYELGECEVKHGVRVSVVNLCTEELGNPAVPEKLKAARLAVAAKRKRAAFRRLSLASLALLVAAAGIGFLFFRYTQRFTGTTSAVPEKSIAVLPFENLSEEKQSAYFADGVQDEILTNLAKVADLKVISRTSVVQYKSGIARNLRQIARELGVANVLEGEVQRAGNHVRINAQLIDARNDVHLWAEHYDRPLDDVFAIQSEIAKAIADQLRAKLSPSEKATIERAPTADLAAFDLYTRAKILISGAALGARAGDDLDQAIELLNEAVARDPAFLLAYCQLANAHDLIYIFAYDHSPGRLASANAAVQTALRLRPDAGEAHLALAQHLYQGYLDYDQALAEIAIAQRTLPNDPLIFQLTGWIARRQGRWDESTRNLEHAIELDPRNVFLLQEIAQSYQALHRYDQMAGVLDRALQINANDVNGKVVRAGVDLYRRADPGPAHAAIATILADDRSAADKIATPWMYVALCERDAAGLGRALVALDDHAFGQNQIVLSRAFGEGLLARMKGDPNAARNAFLAARDVQEQKVQAQPDYAAALVVLGLIDAELGRKDEALREGRHAVELCPITRDAINGTDVLEYFAIICASTGEKDLAIEQLNLLLQRPCFLSYGDLKLHPFWDPLRDDPRFETIVASLAPKGTTSK
jgi:TolB-like protein/class 3 adenylate cyclase/Tfp pilus assembly protein PilF